MTQDIIVILIVSACCLWLGRQALRFFRPKPGQKGCAGGCCEGQPAKPAAAGPRTMMISSDDLRTRLAARRK